MPKPTKTNLNLFVMRFLSRSFRFVLFLVALTGVFLYTRVSTPTHVSAATSSYLNFQARLLSSTGSLVPDGTYNVEFKLYDSLAAGASAQGVCVGGATDDCLWVETRTAGNKVTVKNGYLSVYLGQVTALPNINWDQDIWLTMNIGGSGAPTWDGEMTPRLKLTAVPYAMSAGTIAKYNGTQTGTLSFNTVANSPDIKLPDITGTNNVLLQSGTTLFSPGSVSFTTANGLLQQDNSNFYFDDTNNTLGIGTTRAGAIDGTGNSRLIVKGSGATSASSSLNVTNSSNASLFYVRDDGNVGVGTTGPGAKLEVDAAVSGIGLIIKANATTPGDLLQLQDSSDNVNAKFNASGNQLTLGRVAGSGSVTAGSLLFADGTTDNFSATITTATITADRKFVLPDTSLATTGSPGTICVFNGAVSNCPAATGSAYYIHNDTALQTSANFNIQAADSGINGTIGGIIRGAAAGQTVDLLQFKSTGGTILSKFDANGYLSIGTSTSPTGGVATFNGNVGIGITSPLAKLHVDETTATTGNIVSLLSSNSSQTTSTLLNVVQSGTTTGYTGNVVNFTGSSTTGASNLLNLTSANTTAGNALNVTANALTTGDAVDINSTSTGLTSGSLLRIATGTTGLVDTNGIVSLNATGNYTSNAGFGLLNVSANATTAGTIATFSGSALTTGTVLNLRSGTALTTGSLLSLGAANTANYNHTAAETGNVLGLTFADTTTLNSAAATITNGIAINPIINVVGGASSNGVKTINGIRVNAPTLTACTGGSNTCIYTGLNIDTTGSLANTTVYSALFNGGNVGIGTANPSGVLHTVATGAKTATYTGNLLTNTATSSTASINKYGLEIQSTGTWNGGSANNVGLYVSSVTGGTNNYDAIFNGGGNVGIGIAAPTAKLEVASDSSAVSGTVTLTAIGGYQTVANTGSYIGLSSSVGYNAASGTLASLVGSQSYATNTGAGTVTTSYGLNAGSTTYDGSTGTSIGIGASTGLYATTAGTKITSGIALLAYTNNYGTNGTIGSATNLFSGGNVNAGTTVDYFYGAYLQAPSGGGTINNKYALVTEANAGNVGIGTTSPTSMLHTVATGAKTATYTGNLLTNTATSSTSSINKYGLEIQSTGTWNGTSARNIGLYVSSVTGGTNNYSAILMGGNVGIGTTTPTGDLAFGGEAARTIKMEVRTGNTAGNNLTIAAGGGGAGASAVAGGQLILQGGSAGGSGAAANGGAVTIAGGAGVGTGTQGLVNLSTTAFTSASVQTFASSASITAGNIDLYSTLPVTASAVSVVVTVPDPAQSIIGRLVYISARSGSNDFTLRFNSARTPIDIAMKANSTATLIWNGTDWTAAGASSSTDLQSAYNNTLTSAGGAELVLNAAGGAADGLTIRNNATTPISGGILEVQSSIGTNLFSVNNFGTELASNGGAETSASFNTDWTIVGAASRTRSTAAGHFVTGLAGASVTTTAVANDGVRNNLSANPVESTTYQVSFAAKLDSGTFTTLDVRYSRDGGTDLEPCTSYSTQTLSTSVWTKITCTILTDNTTASNPDLIIRQTDATARTFYIDNLSFMRNDTTTQPSNVQIGGGINGGPVTLFTLDRSTAPPVANGNTTYYGSMYYDTTTGSIQCYEADGWGACGSPPDNIITLTPEYTGAVLNGTGVGTLTADFCSNSAVLTVGTLCGSNNSRQFYRWTSPQATEQIYNMYVSYKLPSTFKNFNSDSTITLTALSDNVTNGFVTYEVFRSTGSAISRCYDGVTNETAVTSTVNTWQTVNINGNETGCGFAGGDNIIFKINVKSKSNANVYVENLNFTYTNR